MLLLPEPIRHPELCEKALYPGQPLPHALSQYRLWGLHPGCVLGEQLQTGDWDQVSSFPKNVLKLSKKWIEFNVHVLFTCFCNRCHITEGD